MRLKLWFFSSLFLTAAAVMLVVINPGIAGAMVGASGIYIPVMAGAMLLDWGLKGAGWFSIVTRILSTVIMWGIFAGLGAHGWAVAAFAFMIIAFGLINRADKRRLLQDSIKRAMTTAPIMPDTERAARGIPSEPWNGRRYRKA